MNICALDETRKAIMAICLFVKPIQLPSLDIAEQVREYADFLRALRLCQEVAQSEYVGVCAKMKEVANLRNDLNTLMSRLRSVAGIDWLYLATASGDTSEDNPQTQTELVDKLQKTMAICARRFEETLQNIEQRVDALAEDMKHFKIVLFGRTKAGKSTVREALTQGNGDTIGKGGQSTTLENHEYNWYNLRVYDTPGILSVRDTNKDEKDGGIGDEERKAWELLQRADIALFLFASDNIEKKELDYLSETARQSKDLLILLNVKSDLSDYRKYKLRHKELDLDPKMQMGHIKRIEREGLTGNPQHYPILPIHAQAGFFSRAKGNAMVEGFYEKFQNANRDELYDLSRFADIRKCLVKSILTKGGAIRCHTIWNFFIQNTRRLANENREPVQKTMNTIQGMTRKIDGAWRKVKKIMDDFRSNCKRKLLADAKMRIDAYSFASDCIEGDKDKNEIKEDWDALLKKELTDLPKYCLDEVMGEIQKVSAELQTQLQFDANTASAFDGFDIGVDWKEVLKLCGRFMGLASGVLITLAAFNIWNPAGWIMWGLAGFSALFSWISNLVKSKANKIKELNSQLTESLEQVCDNISDNLLKVLDQGTKDEKTGKEIPGPFQVVTKTFGDALANQKRMTEIWRGFLQLNDSLQDKAIQAERTMTLRLKQLSGNNNKEK